MELCFPSMLWGGHEQSLGFVCLREKEGLFRKLFVSPFPIFCYCPTLRPPKSAATWEDPAIDKEKKKSIIRSIPVMDPERLVVETSPGPFESPKIFALRPEMVID